MRKIFDLFRRPEQPKHTMEDELLGTLTWEDQVGWRGVMSLANGKTAGVTLDAAKTDESLPQKIRDTIKFVIANEPRFHQEIATAMSKIYEQWSGEEEISPDEMARRINLYELSVYGEDESDGEICDGQLMYEADDNLFTDHLICSYLDANGEIDEPSLEG